MTQQDDPTALVDWDQRPLVGLVAGHAEEVAVLVPAEDLHVGFGRSVASEIEVPILLANLV
jgi:hypothetical protein